jgi:hypothetical protein
MKSVARLLFVATVMAVSCGCSAAIYHVAGRAGHSTPPQPTLNLAREDLDGKFGAPISLAPLPDGGQLATYKYRQTDSKAADMAKTSAEIHAAIGGLTQGMGWFLISPIVELVMTPMAIHRATNPPRGEVEFTLSPDGLLMGYGRPPSYGPDDAAVEAPSVGAIRRGCSAFSEERAYVECLASRFAVWGIE